MKIIKTVILSILLLAVVAIISLNSLSTEVNNPPQEYSKCSAMYYHPARTFSRRSRVKPDNNLFWITVDNQVVTDLILMPGMSVSLEMNEDVYTLTYQDNISEDVGIDITKDEVDYLIDNIAGLKLNGEQVMANDYFGFIDGQLTKVTSDEMLGQASGCKESK